MITLSSEDQTLFNRWAMDRFDGLIPEVVYTNMWVGDSQLAKMLGTYGVDERLTLATIRYIIYRLCRFPLHVAWLTRHATPYRHTTDYRLDIVFNENETIPSFLLTVRVTDLDGVESLCITLRCDFTEDTEVKLEETYTQYKIAYHDSQPFRDLQIGDFIELALDINDTTQTFVTPTTFAMKGVDYTLPNDELGTPGIGVVLALTFTFPEGAWVIEST